MVSPANRSPLPTQRPYALALWALLALFTFRVLAQFLQWQWHVPSLPPFEAWHSAVLPYEALLATQLLIIAVLGRVAVRFTQGRMIPTSGSARAWLVFGMIYLVAMLLRLILGLTVLSGHHWFSNHLPTGFHIVLALFAVTVGFFHYRHAP